MPADIDLTYHYPPEVLALLIDTIPLLCRSKKDVLQFFRGAGVPPAMTKDLAAHVESSPDSTNKYAIVRTTLTRLNEGGEATLRERREVLRRIVQFEDYSTCWPNDQLKAQGLVAQLQRVVNVKDSFTRIDQEREAERRARREQAATEAVTLQGRKAELERIKAEFFRLFSENNPWRRGKTLEAVLNQLFKAHGVLVREAFTLIGDEGEGVVEQIDGVIDLDGDLYLVEVKWWSTPLGPGDVAQHMVRVFSRGQARGLFIAQPGFTDAALVQCKDGLQQAVFVLCDLQEIVRLMEESADLKAVLKLKVRAAIMEKQPLFRAW
jgi:restriction system protein